MSGTRRIELREFCGVFYEGKDLQPAENPHEVSAGFAAELVAGGRARYAPGAPAVEHNDPASRSSDPAAANADPQPRGRGRK